MVATARAAARIRPATPATPFRWGLPPSGIAPNGHNYAANDNGGRSSLIVRPDNVRWPYIIYTGVLNPTEFKGIASISGGGYVWKKDARDNRGTNYAFGSFPNQQGRHFYLRDITGGKKGSVWNPGKAPTLTPLDRSEAEQGYGWEALRSEKDEITSQLLIFAPRDEACEIHQLTLTNNSQEEREIEVVSVIEFCRFSAPDHANNHQKDRSMTKGELIREEGSTTVLHTTAHHRKSSYTYHTSYDPNAQVAADLEEWAGEGINGSFQTPRALMEEGYKYPNKPPSDNQPMSAQRSTIVLKPGQSVTLNYVLGMEETPEGVDKSRTDQPVDRSRAERVIRKFSDPAVVNAAYNELLESMDETVSLFRVESPSEILNQVANDTQYQSLINYEVSRSASYFEPGIGRGLGFRDSSQDIAGFVHMAPQEARQRIIDILGTQFIDGGNYHQYQPGTKKGNADIGGGFNDDPLWPILAVKAYIAETGDTSILNELVAFSPNPENRGSESSRRSRSGNT
jgi:cellobiose phosphorylase